MRRIGRWVIDALTALSLLLCVGTSGLWLGSYLRAAGASWEHYDRESGLVKQRTNSLVVTRGHLGVGHIFSESTDGYLVHYGIDPASLKSSFRFEMTELKAIATMGNTSNSREYAFAGFRFAHILY